MPYWLRLIIVMAATGTVIYVITGLVQRRVRADDDPSQTPDVIEYMTMMIGVVYAIVLGLAIAGAWEARNEAQTVVQNESQALHEVAERAQVFPAADRERIRRSIDAYAAYVADKEWPEMAAKGQLTDRGDQLFGKVRTAVLRSEPRDELQGQAYTPMADQIALADEARTNRGESAQPTMPPVVWFGLIVGAVVSIGMVFALQIRRTARELTVAMLYCALFAFLLFLIWDMDAPFGRGMAITPDPFLALRGR
ncbi:DUF4239 domain-containing protein [Streptomyces kanamyceticus]|uniref:DUF4239 domain-containing protein n=1 Tax=Streptomyces kanamyceticus TaxID=1967 RepID=A0A5J6G2H1_STRKN|nr:DUF4239 domain-containing protein [Streptomyces kanamyceticus]QEU89790.1 DUF4239 domain-containing protein [Streptomyces kanamyceticus]